MKMLKLFLMISVATCVFGCAEYNLKKQVANGMKDPSSVQFRKTKMVDDSLCGEINSKNSYGGFSGFGRFVVVAVDTAVLNIQVEEKPHEIDMLWEEICEKKGSIEIALERGSAYEMKGNSEAEFRKAMALQIRDPDSLRFRNTKVMRTPAGYADPSIELDALCGEVGIRNSYGEEYSRFVVMPLGTRVRVEIESKKNDIDLFWRSYCEKKGT